MARGSNIGGMLAQSGLAGGQNIAQAYQQLGRGVGGMFSGVAGALERRQERRRAESAQEQFQQILGAYENNPEELRRQGLLAQQSSDPNLQRMGQMLIAEATRVQGVQTAKAEKGTAQGIQGGLSAITQAAMRGVPLTDLQEGVRSIINLGGTQAQITEAYEAGVAKPADIYKVVGNRVFNTETGQYVEPSEAAELLPLSTIKDAVTPESLLEYIQTGDKSVLQAITEEDPDTGVIASKLLATDATLNTIKEAAGLAEEIYPLVYDIAQFAPTTNARELRNRVQTLQSVLSFDRLQQMRNESKTGGALGNVSNVELGLLGSNLAALDPTSKSFGQQLKKVEEHYNNFKRSLLGQKPLGDRYIEDEGILYYVDDENNYVSLGKL